MKLTRLSVGQWFCLLVGMVIMLLQTFKYFNNTLELTISEALVTILAVGLMFAPRTLSEAFKIIVKRKVGQP